LQISFFIERPPPFVGGLQNVCLRVAKHFENSGARVRIVGFPDKVNSTRLYDDLRWEHEGVEVRELRRGKEEDFLLRWVPILKKRRVTFPLAVVCYRLAYAAQIEQLCHGSSLLHYFGTGMELNGFAVANAAKKLGARFLVEPAIHAGSCGDSWLDAPLYRLANMLLAHTEFEAGIIHKMGIPKCKIRAIVHGVDFCDSGDGACFRGKNGIAGPMVLFLGRKTATKGIGRLLEAWPMVAKKFPEATIVIAGPKNADFEKQKAESRNLPTTGDPLPATAPEALPQVLNLDELTESEKQDALAACDILCVPSEGESFGMVYFEAWAYKKPVVALNLPVLQETIGLHGGGLLCTPEPSAIAKSLIDLLRDTNMQKAMGEKGYEAALRHNWPIALESYAKAYQDACIQ